MHRRKTTRATNNREIRDTLSRYDHISRDDAIDERESATRMIVRARYAAIEREALNSRKSERESIG